MKRLVLLTAMGATVGLWTAWAGDNVWTSLGPDGGGARSLVIDPLNPNTVYALTSAGLFKSTDGGANWRATPLGQPKPGVVTSLVIDPHNSSTLYATGTEAWGRGVRALLKSTDEGANWRVLTALNAYGDPAHLAIDPEDPNILYAGNYNQILSSTDGGETWKPLNVGLPNRNIHSLAIDPRNPSTVYAVTGTAIFKSKNRGADWSAVYSYSEARPGFAALAIDPQDSNTLYAHRGFFGEAGGFYKSSDGGASWRAANSGLPNGSDDAPFPYFQIRAVAIHPRNAGTLFAATPDGLFKSTDGAETWTKLDSQPDAGGVHALALDPQNPDAIYASADSSAGGSLHKSTNGGANWRSANTGLRALGIRRLAIAPQQPAALYASATNWPFDDKGWFLKSTDEGTSWSNVPSMTLLAIDPQNPATLFGTGPHGLEKSTDGGENWSPAKDGLPEGPGPRVSSLTIDPQDSRTVYAGLQSQEIGSQNGGVWKSTDGGAGWTKLESKPAGGGVHGLAIDPKTDTLYAWNGNGLSRSTDRGGSWSKLGNSTGVTALTIDPQSPGTLYGAYQKPNGHYDDPDSVGVIKSRDGGESWTAVTSGLPRDDLTFNWVDITALVIDPRNTSTLYAATSANGVYRTTDGGATWGAMNSGLTTMKVFALAVDPRDSGTVYAGTAGGVFAITFAAQ